MLNASDETGFIAGVDVIKGSRSTCDGKYLADNKIKKVLGFRKMKAQYVSELQSL